MKTQREDFKPMNAGDVADALNEMFYDQKSPDENKI